MVEGSDCLVATAVVLLAPPVIDCEDLVIVVNVVFVTVTTVPFTNAS